MSLLLEILAGLAIGWGLLVGLARLFWLCDAYEPPPVRRALVITIGVVLGLIVSAVAIHCLPY